MSVHLDFETRSKLQLMGPNGVGAFRYLEHESAQILCMAFSIDEREPELWHPAFPLVPEELDNPSLSFMFESSTSLDELFERIHEGDEFWAHNASFERCCFEIICGPRLGWPVPNPRQWRCTMAMCFAHALPGSLDAATRVLGLAQRKDMEGKKIMQRLTKPRRPSKKNSSLWHEDPLDLLKLFDYCKQDVRSEIALKKVLRPLSPEELEVYHVDQAINFRGVALDTPFCRAAKKAKEQREVKLEKEVQELTGGEVGSFTEIDKQMKWLAGRGVVLENLRKETVRDALAHDDCALESVGAGEEVGYEPMPSKARRLLELRAAGGKTSVAKYAKFLKMRSADGRLKGMYQYHGSHTGRWAGRGGQLQNIVRGVSAKEQEWIIKLLLSGGLPLLELFYEGPIDELSKIIRGALIAEEGKKLIVSDYAAIEARGVFWLAGQEDLLELYRQGEDLYCWMAERIFGRDREEIRGAYKEGDPEATRQRFVGKQTTLGAGYQMGPERFQGYCAQLGVEVSWELSELAIGTFRESAPKVKSLWAATQKAAIRAVQNPGEQVRAGKTKWKKVGRFLHCLLPSGRLLSYYNPTVKRATAHTRPKRLPDGTIVPGKAFETWKLSYWGAKNNRWGRNGTFGGLLVENVCQATTRDLMADCMVRLEGLHWDVIMHSHDEIIAEVWEDDPLDARGLEGLMEQTPAWARGLPVKAEAWEGKRYRK